MFQILLFLAFLLFGANSAQAEYFNGAIDRSAAYEKGESSDWSISSQRSFLRRYGLPAVYDGVVKGNKKRSREMMDKAIEAVNWAFAHQSADGGFGSSDKGDVRVQYHSVAIVLPTIEEFIDVLEKYYPGVYRTQISSWTPHIYAAQKWLINNVDFNNEKSPGMLDTSLDTHRKFMDAAAILWLGPEIKPNDPMRFDPALNFRLNPGITFIKQGLARQIKSGADAGVNPEQHGYDTSYQAAGQVYQAFIVSNKLVPPDLARAMVENMSLGSTWEAGRIETDGSINDAGDKRVGAKGSLGDDGKKADDKAAIATAFYRSYQFTNNPLFMQKYQLVARKYVDDTKQWEITSGLFIF